MQERDPELSEALLTAVYDGVPANLAGVIETEIALGRAADEYQRVAAIGRRAHPDAAAGDLYDLGLDVLRSEIDAETA